MQAMSVITLQDTMRMDREKEIANAKNAKAAQREQFWRNQPAASSRHVRHSAQRKRRENRRRQAVRSSEKRNREKRRRQAEGRRQVKRNLNLKHLQIIKMLILLLQFST
jgi:hypothetical protein